MADLSRWGCLILVTRSYACFPERLMAGPYPRRPDDHFTGNGNFLIIKLPVAGNWRRCSTDHDQHGFVAGRMILTT